MKKKKDKIWLKSLKETAIQYIYFVIVIVIFLFLKERHVYFTWELIGLLIWFPFSIILAVFISYFIIYSKIKRIKKIIYASLVYFIISLFPTSFLLIVGYIGNITNNADAGWAMIFGIGLFKLQIVPIIFNYLFLYFKNRKQFNIHKK